jgi:Polyketide cyclase / dehydrase and lipid transport
MKKSNQKVVMSIDTTPAAAWEVIGAVNGVDQWMAPMITSCRVDGDKRYCGTEGGEFEEDIISVDHENRVFKYGIPKQHMIPVENILGTMKVHKGADNKALVEWSWTFDVLEGKETEAKEILNHAGQVGLKGIEQLLMAKSAA